MSPWTVVCVGVLVICVGVLAAKIYNLREDLDELRKELKLARSQMSDHFGAGTLPRQGEWVALLSGRITNVEKRVDSLIDKLGYKWTPRHEVPAQLVKRKEKKS